MGGRGVDPTWPLARLASSFSASAIREICNEDRLLWVYDGRPLDYWRLERIEAVFRGDYLLPFYTFPRQLWIPGEPPMVNAKARFLPDREPITSRRATTRQTRELGG